MTKNNLIYGLISLFIVAGNSLFAQFSGRDGEDLKSCDCNKQLDSLNITFRVPSNLAAYDILGFEVRLNNNAIAYQSMSARELSPGSRLVFNLLDPTVKGERSLLTGEEEGKYKGEMQISYNNLCEARRGISKLNGRVIGIKQVGTNTEYKVESNGTISAKSHKLYDDGVVTSTTSDLEIIHPKKLKGRFLSYGVYGVLAISGLATFLTTSALAGK